jgi:succinate-semialdehyde dehydrogenase / glutarate-semialdehyde dehydrogenase
MAIQSVNPVTGTVIETFEPISESELNAKLDTATEAYRRYRRVSFDVRAEWVVASASILEEEAETIGRVMTEEMGKPIGAAIAEVRKCAWVCRYYAEHAKAFLEERHIETESPSSFVAFQPIGTILAVMPWNFPLWQYFRHAAPAIMAGNTILLKHSSNVPRSALLIEEVLRRAGVPEGIHQTLLLPSDRIAALIEDDRVQAVTLTGSNPAGSAVGATAGRMIKKSVLELGGSDPFIVMPSARMETAVNTAVRARIINNGQSCIAAKRFIVHRDAVDRFLPPFVAQMEALRIGDPLDPETQVGPLATEGILTELMAQVERSVEGGARLLTGGYALDRPGWFFKPTVLIDIPRNAPAYSEELFGPVASVFPVDSLDEAITVANDSEFGLAASVWTSDDAEVRRCIEDLEVGTVAVNRMVASDPRLPFGGIKRSGYGRELSSEGIREFVNVKTVVIE